MYKRIALVIICLISPISFADNLAMQKQIELQDSLSSDFNTAVYKDQYPALNLNTSSGNIIGNGLDSGNSKIDTAMSDINPQEQNS